MTTIKDLIQETENNKNNLVRCNFCHDTINVNDRGGIQVSPVMAHTRCSRVYDDTLKKCQTIADEKLKEEIEFLEDSDWYGASCSLIFVKRQKRLLKLIKQLNPAQTKNEN
jgi:hypothetical protein